MSPAPQVISKAPSAALAKGLIPEIDGLRGIAILLVMMHRFWPGTGLLAPYSRFGELGWVGVDLFFVVSGFLITGILLDTRDKPHFFRNFYARRALRIFPLYYVFIGLIFLLPLAKGGPYLSSPFIAHTGSPLWYLFYLGNVPEALLGKELPYFLAPVWSLAIEEQFYISFPSVVRVLTPRRLVGVLVGLLIFSPLVRLLTMLIAPGNERIQYQFTLCRLDVIAFGALLAVAVRHAPRLPSPHVIGRAAAALLAVSAVVFAFGGLDRTAPFGRVAGYSIVGATFAAVVLSAVMNRGSAGTAWLRAAPLRYLGQVCYGLYLLHRPADLLVAKLADRADVDAGAVVLIPLKMAVAVALASVSWFAFEKQFLRLKSAFVSQGHPSEAAVSAPAPTPPMRAGEA